MLCLVTKKGKLKLWVFNTIYHNAKGFTEEVRKKFCKNTIFLDGGHGKKCSIFLYKRDFPDLKQSRGEDSECFTARMQQSAPAM